MTLGRCCWTKRVIRMAGPSTVLGDAVGLSIKLFRQADTENRVLLLLTDGNDTGSIVPPH